jgi:limonene-1,2-epoxide hydrolase
MKAWMAVLTAAVLSGCASLPQTASREAFAGAASHPSQGADTMQPAAETPLAVVRAYLREMEAMNFEEGVKHIADDAEYANMMMPTVRGPAGVRAALEPFFAPVVRNEFVILREVVNGNVVFVERLDRHLLKTGWVELPVTGVFEVKDGKIAIWREYFDLATIQSNWPAPN